MLRFCWILGGLISETDSKVDAGIPIIKDIPLIGHAAKNTVTNKARTELMIFIQPVVVRSNQEAVFTSYDEDVRSDIGEDAAQAFPEPGVPTIQQRAEVVEDAMIKDQPLKRLGQKIFGKKKKEREPLPLGQ